MTPRERWIAALALGFRDAVMELLPPFGHLDAVPLSEIHAQCAAIAAEWAEKLAQLAHQDGIYHRGSGDLLPWAAALGEMGYGGERGALGDEEKP